MDNDSQQLTIKPLWPSLDITESVSLLQYMSKHTIDVMYTFGHSTYNSEPIRL